MSKYCWDLLQSLTLKSSLVPAGFRCEGSSVTPWRQSCSTKTFNRAEPRNTFPRVHSHMCLNSILCSFFVVAFFLTTHPISHLWLDNRDTTTATDDATYETVSENLLAAFTWRCSDWLTCILTSQRYKPLMSPLLVVHIWTHDDRHYKLSENRQCRKNRSQSHFSWPSTVTFNFNSKCEAPDIWNKNE